MIKIKLSCNFQTLELEYKSLEDAVMMGEVDSAINMIKSIGAQFDGEMQKKEKQPPKEPATEGQINWMVNLGLDEATAKNMSKQEARKWISENR
jgi:hypothetical protein